TARDARIAPASINSSIATASRVRRSGDVASAGSATRKAAAYASTRIRVRPGSTSARAAANRRVSGVSTAAGFIIRDRHYTPRGDAPTRSVLGWDQELEEGGVGAYVPPHCPSGGVVGKRDDAREPPERVQVGDARSVDQLDSCRRCNRSLNLDEKPCV